MTMPTLPLEIQSDEVYGERVRDARLIQRLKANVVAQLADIPPDRYSRIENSISSQLPHDRALILAQSLNFPLSFLTTPPATPVQRESMLFRARKAMTKGEEDQLVAWARLIGDFLYGSETFVRFPVLRLPRFGSVAPQIAAGNTRKALGVAAGEPVSHLMRLLERAGVFVANIEFDAELHARNHDAYSTWVGAALDQPLIVTRTVSSWERIRMSVAHELGHLVMHRIRRSGDLEAEAYAFGSEFLLPGDRLRDEWPGHATIMSLLPIKQKWGVSLAGLIEHGYRNQLLSPNDRSNLYKQLSNRKDRLTGQRWRIQEPGWRDRNPERPKLIARIGEVAFGTDPQLSRISAQSCNWPERFIRQLIAGQTSDWSDRLSGTEAAFVSSAEVLHLHR